VDPSARRECEEAGVVDLGGLRAMMVLLLKQMHLQKDVAEAVWVGDLAEEAWLGWGAGNGLG
jgi:hypothetical protein